MEPKKTRKKRKPVTQSGYVEGPINGSYYWRYRSTPDGAGYRHRLAAEIGQKGQFHSLKEAEDSVELAKMKEKANAGVLGVTVGQVIAHYQRDNMPSRDNSTIMYSSSLKHCLLKWENFPLDELAKPTNAKIIEGWLKGLKKMPYRKGVDPNEEVSYSVKRNVGVILGTVFDFAMTMGYLPSMENPMRLVKLEEREDEESEPRQCLTLEQLDAFFNDLEIPLWCRTMGHCARINGLRISEIRGLTWDRFDLDAMTVTVKQRMFRNPRKRGSLNKPKSKASGKTRPLSEELVDILQAWRNSTSYYAVPEGWLFANPATKVPYSSEGAQTKILKPWGDKHGVKRMGWHTFRHTFRQIMDDNNVDPFTQMEMLRHSTLPTTWKYGEGKKLETLRAHQAMLLEAMKPKPQLVVKKRQWA